MASWLNRCSPWQCGLTLGGVTFVLVMVVGALVQWLWHGHLDLSTLLGAATGCALATVLFGAARQASRPGSR